MFAFASEFIIIGFILGDYASMGIYITYSAFMGCLSLIYAVITLVNVKLILPLIEEYKENLKNVEKGI